MTNHDDLRSFLYETTQAGYGNEATAIDKADDGGNVISYTNGSWHMQDHFYGGHPYSGQEVIHEDGKPVWALQYRGWVHDTERTPSEVYGFLKKALLAAPKDHPYRGPAELIHGDLVYRNHWQGDLDNFIGEEAILENNVEIYKAWYFGGFVDQ